VSRDQQGEWGEGGVYNMWALLPCDKRVPGTPQLNSQTRISLSGFSLSLFSHKPLVGTPFGPTVGV